MVILLTLMLPYREMEDEEVESRTHTSWLTETKIVTFHIDRPIVLPLQHSISLLLK